MLQVTQAEGSTGHNKWLEIPITRDYILWHFKAYLIYILLWVQVLLELLVIDKSLVRLFEKRIKIQDSWSNGSPKGGPLFAHVNPDVVSNCVGTLQFNVEWLKCLFILWIINYYLSTYVFAPNLIPTDLLRLSPTVYDL